MGHPRNTDGLRQTAQERSHAALHRTEAAITLLLKENRPVNFSTVAHRAQVSTAWLYKNEAIKRRILELRASRTPGAGTRPKVQTSDASKDAMLAALQLRVKRQDDEIKQLRQQLEVAYGLLYRNGDAPATEAVFRGVAGAGEPAPKAGP